MNTLLQTKSYIAHNEELHVKSNLQQCLGRRCAYINWRTQDSYHLIVNFFES